MTKANLAQMADFIKAHPGYPELMRQLEKIPDFLLPMSKSKLVPPAGAGKDATLLARHFGKQYFQAFRHWNSGRYMGTIAKQLNGRINMFRALGRHATWYVPAVIGLYNAYEAPQEVRLHTLFEEGFGIVGGMAGAWLGGELIGAGIASVLCLGPLGAFLLVFILATGAGLYFSEKFRRLGAGIYDYGSVLNTGIIFHSPEQFLESN